MTKQPTPSVDKAWEYMHCGEYRRAIHAFTTILDAGGKPGLVVSRGRAYLNMGEYEFALRDFQRILTLRNPRLWSEDDYISQAVCYWWLDGPFEAAAIMRHATVAPYMPYGGPFAPALLLYMAERMHDAGVRQEAMRLLRKDARRRHPSPVTMLILGTMTESEYFERVPFAGPNVNEIL